MSAREPVIPWCSDWDSRLLYDRAHALGMLELCARMNGTTPKIRRPAFKEAHELYLAGKLGEPEREKPKKRERKAKPVEAPKLEAPKGTPLHHLHAAPAGASTQRGAVSFDIGTAIRIRLDGGTEDQKHETVRRLVQLWNMHEAIPTPVLELGAVRAFYDSVQALVDVLKEANPPPETAAAAEAVGKAWEAITLELTADGRRAECPCAEQVGPRKEGDHDGSQEAGRDPRHGEEGE